MNPSKYKHGLLVTCREGDIGELVHNKGLYLVVLWLTGPRKGECYIEVFEYLDILSPEEETMYRLAHLGGGK